MAHINLLPWRAEAEKAKQKEFFTLLAAVALGAFAIVFIISQFFQAQIEGQQTRNQFLQNEIKVLDIRIGEIKTLTAKKKALQERTSVVVQLQRSRNVGTQVFDELAKIVPNGIYLTQLKKQHNIIRLNGKSESNNHLANMIRAIERSDLLTEATLESITSTDANSKLLSDFKMRIRIKGLDAEQIEETVKDVKK
ncbi:MAG: type IV pilus assembly protein PilN [Alteromonadaceae bacterium]|jgi:type IV pilus assembly protein PilN